jgi:DNA-binding SARP family transcriptional activator
VTAGAASAGRVDTAVPAWEVRSKRVGRGGDGRRPEHRAAASPRPAAGVGVTTMRRIGLLRGFELLADGDPVALPVSAQRVLAFLALQGRPVQRLYVAGALWLDASETKANASLRTALWRLGRVAYRLVDASATHLALAEGVEVDLTEATTVAEAAIGGAPEALDRTALLARAGDLLPDWYEDWVLIEREHFRQLRLHALEGLCEQLTAAGRFAEATEAGAAAVKAEPLRESAHRALIRTFLAEGNTGEAIRQYHRFHELLERQLGLEPSQLMEDLLAPLRRVTRR